MLLISAIKSVFIQVTFFLNLLLKKIKLINNNTARWNLQNCPKRVSHQLAGVGPWCHSSLKVEPLDTSPHGDRFGGSWCRRRGPPQWVDEASELERYVHFCSGAKNDGGAAENGHLAMEWWVMKDEDRQKWKHINRGTTISKKIWQGDLFYS